MTKIIGADLAINHGAVVGLDGKIYYTYDKDTGIQTKSFDIFEEVRRAAYVIPRRSKVVIDWDRDACNYRKKFGKGNPLIAVLMAIYAHDFGTICIESRGCTVHYVAPDVVRKCLGLSEKLSKEEVHKEMWDIFPANLTNPKVHRLKDVRGDILDAYLLAEVNECAMEYS